MEILVIPDTQSKENVKNPLIAIAYHICKLKPHYVIHLGDHWDFPSLSYYDKGKKCMEAKSYMIDLEAGNQSMAEFWQIINDEWPSYFLHCRFIILNGNHEFRRDRAMQYGDNNLRDLMTLNAPNYKYWDNVVPFLKIIKIGGVSFSHYFQNLNSDRPIGTARQILIKNHRSCIAGHLQGFDYAEQLADNRVIQALIIGSCYFHEEEYKAQSNHHWRGTVLLRNVKDGQFDFARFSLDHLDKIYGNN